MYCFGNQRLCFKNVEYTIRIFYFSGIITNNEYLTGVFPLHLNGPDPSAVQILHLHFSSSFRFQMHAFLVNAIMIPIPMNISCRPCWWRAFSEYIFLLSTFLFPFYDLYSCMESNGIHMFFSILRLPPHAVYGWRKIAGL